MHRVCETQSNFDSCTWKCEKKMEPWKHKIPMSKSDFHLMLTPESLPSYKVYKDMQQRWTTCNRMFLIDIVTSVCLSICLGRSYRKIRSVVVVRPLACGPSIDENSMRYLEPKQKGGVCFHWLRERGERVSQGRGETKLKRKDQLLQLSPTF